MSRDSAHGAREGKYTDEREFFSLALKKALKKALKTQSAKFRFRFADRVRRRHATLMATIFVYGTLMADDVLRALIKRVPRGAPALLPGHTRYAARGRVYPGMVPNPAPGASVRGRLLFELDEGEIRVFDAFEGDEYVKTKVTALHLPSNDATDGPTVQADAYLWCAPRSELTEWRWDYEAWVAADLERYAKMCAQFAAELNDLAAN